MTTNTNKSNNPLKNQTISENQKITTPIHLLPSELLSWIFELCSWKDWRSPLCISYVCTNWRHIVLSSPRAWCSISIDSNCSTWKIYLKRSGQCDLHIGCRLDLPPIEVIGRIKGMNLEAVEHGHFNFLSHCFPRLEWLFVNGASPPDFSGPYNMSMSSFPMLRHLHLLHRWLPINLDCSSVPALESLSLHTHRNDDTWLGIIRGCLASLTSLSLYVDSSIFNHASVAISLPKLYYLGIDNVYGSNMNWLSITAPALCVYTDQGISESRRCNIANGLRLITHLRLPGLRSLHSLSNICSLQTQSSIPVYRGLLEELRTGTTSLLYLKDLQFLDENWMDRKERERFTQEVKEWNAQNNLSITLAFVNSWKELWNPSFPASLLIFCSVPSDITQGGSRSLYLPQHRAFVGTRDPASRKNYASFKRGGSRRPNPTELAI